MKLQIINGPNLNLLGTREKKFMAIKILMSVLKVYNQLLKILNYIIFSQILKEN